MILDTLTGSSCKCIAAVVCSVVDPRAVDYNDLPIIRLAMEHFAGSAAHLVDHSADSSAERPDRHAVIPWSDNSVSQADNLYSDSVCGYGRKSYNSGDDMCRLCCEFTLSAPWHQTLLPNWVIGVIDADTDSAEQPVQSLLVDHSVHSVHRVVASALQCCIFCLP